MIRERAAARAEYEQAKAEGRKAALVEQERPNVFTTSVAHIGPGEDIVVTIEYQQTLRFDAGTFRLRFPLVVTPRYIPGSVDRGGDRRHRLGAGHRRKSPTRPRSRRRSSPPATRLRQPGDARGRPQSPAFRWRGSRARTTRSPSARPPDGRHRVELAAGGRPGRPRLRARLDARRRQRPGRGAVHRDRDGGRTTRC